MGFIQASGNVTIYVYAIKYDLIVPIRVALPLGN